MDLQLLLFLLLLFLLLLFLLLLFLLWLFLLLLLLEWNPHLLCHHSNHRTKQGIGMKIKENTRLKDLHFPGCTKCSQGIDQLRGTWPNIRPLSRLQIHQGNYHSPFCIRNCIENNYSVHKDLFSNWCNLYMTFHHLSCQKLHKYCRNDWFHWNQNKSMLLHLGFEAKHHNLDGFHLNPLEFTCLY